MKPSVLFCGIGIALAALGIRAEGDESHYLHIRTNDGWTAIDLNRIDRLTFKDGNMIATDNEQKTIGNFPQSTLTSMFIDEKEELDLSGVENIGVSEEGDKTFHYDTATSMARMVVSGEFIVYNLKGETLLRIPEAKAQEVIDLSAITDHVLIIKSGSYSLKTFRK